MLVHVLYPSLSPCLTPLAGLTSLTELSLAGCQALTEFGVRWLRDLRALRVLSLEMCHLACGLDQLRGLRWGLGGAGM